MNIKTISRCPRRYHSDTPRSGPPPGCCSFFRIWSTCQPLSLCHAEDAESLGKRPKETLGPSCRKALTRRLCLEVRWHHLLVPKACFGSSSKTPALVCVSTEAFEEMSQREWSSGKNITFFVQLYWTTLCPYQLWRNEAMWADCSPVCP